MYIVMEASENMPSSCMGRYRRVAVVEVADGYDDNNNRPKMISERARGIIRIIAQWRKQNVGITDKCAFSKAMKAAREMAKELNNEKS